MPEMKEEVQKSMSEEHNVSQRVQPSESKEEIKLTKTSSTQNNSIQRVQSSESKEIKLTKTSATQNKSIQRVQPSESKEEIKLTKTNSTQNKSICVEPSESKEEIVLTKTNSTQGKSIQRVSFESNEEIELVKTSSTHNEPMQSVELSESEEIKSTKTNSTKKKSLSSFHKKKKKNAFLASLRAPRTPKRMRSLPHQLDDGDLMKMETESISTESQSKSDQQAALIPQERSSEKSIGQPPESVELDSILDKTKTDSTDLLEASSVCFPDTNFDHFKEIKEMSYGLLEKFGHHVKDLKEKQGKSTYYM